MIRRPIALVLSGGGARSAAHIGAIQALSERDLFPDRFVGTSMGAVIAACFATGLEYPEVLQRMTAITRKDVATFSPGIVLGPLARSLLQEGPFRETLEVLVSARTFAELATPLTVTAVDARSGDLVLFGAGGRSHVPLIDALYATCALPVYYPAAKIGDREFTDGGVRAVFPLDVAGDFGPGTVIGVNVGPSRYDQAQPAGLGAKGIVAAHRRAMRIMMAIQIEQTIARWRDDPPVDCMLVEPPVTRAGTFAIDRVIEYVEQGYRATMRALSQQDDG